MASKRRILTAGVGIAAITALEGLACGNPVAPRCPGHAHCVPDAPPSDAPPEDAGVPDAGVPDAEPTSP